MVGIESISQTTVSYFQKRGRNVKSVVSFSVKVALAFSFLAGCTPVSGPGSGTGSTNPTTSKVFTSGQAASIVIGQPDMTTASYPSGVSGSVIDGPRGMTLTTGGVLFVTDDNYSRILAYNTVPTANGASADFAIGQPDVNSFAQQGSQAYEVHNPESVSAAGTQLFVADSSNSRVLIYNAATTSDVSASVALGQADTMSGTTPSGASATSFLPSDVFVSGSQIAIADGFNRVLLYNSIPTASGAAANLVLGQADMTSHSSGASTMALPNAVWTNGTQIAVADMNNHRVLIWNAWPTANGTPANIVLGQPNMASTLLNYPAGSPTNTSASSLFSPQGVASDGTALYVADNGNNRVLIWSTWPTVTQQAADLVLGQPDFTSYAPATSATNMNGPENLLFDGTSLFVSDRGNDRVLIFNKQ